MSENARPNCRSRPNPLAAVLTSAAVVCGLFISAVPPASATPSTSSPTSGTSVAPSILQNGCNRRNLERREYNRPAGLDQYRGLGHRGRGSNCGTERGQ